MIKQRKEKKSHTKNQNLFSHHARVLYQYQHVKHVGQNKYSSIYALVANITVSFEFLDLFFKLVLSYWIAISWNILDLIKQIFVTINRLKNHQSSESYIFFFFNHFLAFISYIAIRSTSKHPFWKNQAKEWLSIAFYKDILILGVIQQKSNNQFIQIWPEIIVPTRFQVFQHTIFQCQQQWSAIYVFLKCNF